MKDAETPEKRKPKFLHSLFLRSYLTYAVLVLLFAVVFGTVFLRLYKNSTIESFKSDLADKADVIAGVFEECIQIAYYEPALDYLEMLSDLENQEVWTVSNAAAKEPMPTALVSVNLNGVPLQEEYWEIIRLAFAGNKSYVTLFSDTHESTVMVMGAPILNPSREVSGALLMIRRMSDMDELVGTSFSLIIVSAVVALFVAFVFAILFTRNITKPISKMRTTALMLAAGKYDVKTEITGKDEIAQFARTLDFLSEKLQENEEIRNNMEQMRLDFFANVSHELRTPIAVVRAYTEMLNDGVVDDPEKIAAYYEKMLAECKGMERLVGDLLLLSKVQNPDFEVQKEPVNLVQIFDDLVRSVKAIGQERNIVLEFIKEKDVYLMMGDYDRLRQMFLVILDNAVKFSNNDSKVVVTMSTPEEKRVRVSIRDFGVGITPEELPQIFDKFYKSKLRQNSKGTGLGLMIAKGICLKHGGTIGVNSKPGEGTEFVFEFDSVSEEELE